MMAGVAQFPVPPVVKEAVISLPLEAAFTRFTREIGLWWPTASHTVSGVETESVMMEERQGGRLFERAKDGREHLWGTITRWEPPSALAFTWHVGRAPNLAQLVELRFRALDESSTTVTLVHSGWEKLGADAEPVRSDYEGGWELVFMKSFTNLKGR